MSFDLYFIKYQEMFDQIRILFSKNSCLSGSALSYKFVISYSEVLFPKK